MEYKFSENCLDKWWQYSPIIGYFKSSPIKSKAVASSDDIAKSIKKFKSYTAKEILNLLQKQNIKTILDQLAFYKKAHKQETTYQIWQEGMQPKLIQTEQMMREKKRLC